MAERGPRRGRIRGLLAIAVRRVASRMRGSSSRRVLAAVCGVAFAVGLMVAVTGVALGLAQPTTVQSQGVDYWIVPSDSSVTAITVDVGQPHLGNVHRVRDRLLADGRIDAVTPVLARVLAVPRAGTNDSDYVVAVGVVPSEATGSVLGVSTAALTPGDPYYANGTYDGTRTGEIALSEGAATVLDASVGSQIDLRASGTVRPFTVVDVDATAEPGSGQLPVAVVHLSELQAMTGTTRADQANQILVNTSAPGVRSLLERVYPATTVVAKRGFASTVPTGDLSLAVAGAAFVTALVVGVLFVGTMMGLEVTADRRQLAVFAVVGYSRRSRTLLVVAEVVCVAACGGLVGVPLGLAGMAFVDAVAAWQFGLPSVTAFHPLLLAYGFGVAVVIGLVAAPYPAWLDTRTAVSEVLRK